MSVLIVGSIALDTVKTPVEEHADLLGGSASYAALGASFFSPVKLVGIVGDDFPESEFEFWKSRKIDAAGVQRVTGKTFRWSGEYAWDMNTRETRSVALNVFEQFRPDLPESYRETDYVLLANIAPALQSHVLDQMKRPRFIVADTMDLWIQTTRADLAPVRNTSRSRKASTAPCFLRRTIFSAAGRIRSRTSTIQPGPATHSRVG
jgi:hypothetical protein